MGIYNLGGGGGAPELQAKEATPLITNAQQIILPDEGYDGLSKVTINPMPDGALKTPTVNSIGYVSAGVQTAGYFDTSATSGLQLSTQSAKTITPTTYSQTAVASGKYTTGAVTVAGDSDLVASNIRSGVNIFGVNGSYAGDPMVCVSANRPSGQGAGTDAYFSFSSTLQDYVSTYYLFALQVTCQVSTPIYDNNKILDIFWYAYMEKYNSFDARTTPFPYSTSVRLFPDMRVRGSNTTQALLTTSWNSAERLEILLDPSSGITWDSSNSYIAHAYFATKFQSYN